MSNLDDRPWKRAVREALISGAVATLISTAERVVVGRLQRGARAGGPSAAEWSSPRRPARLRAAGLANAVPRFLVQQLASLGLALINERVFGRQPVARSAVHQLRNAAITAAVGNIVGRRLTHSRLPQRSSGTASSKGAASIYIAIAIGLALFDRGRRGRPGKHGQGDVGDRSAGRSVRH